jgi:hypothetical protein
MSQYPIQYIYSQYDKMVDSNLFNIPLSPPTSPRLSSLQGEQGENSWQEQQSKAAEEHADSNNNNGTIGHGDLPSLTLDTSQPLKGKPFPYSLRAGAPDTPPLNSSGGSPGSAHPDDLSAGLDDIPSAEIPSVTFGGSTPTSPMSNMTPTSPGDLDMPRGQDLNGLNIDLDPSEEGEKKQMSAAEIRAQKRKMKRFRYDRVFQLVFFFTFLIIPRLTHNQTRFLMSEFARQAHPDAAHRERLAREIPGLSPRQVQVWFQNRRAKLKRLTSDDRERMMRSRALPDDFDMTQALHSPFGAVHNVGSTLSSPAGYSPTLSESSGIRPLNFDSLRRMPGGHNMSPSIGPGAFGGFNFTPPQSVADGLSPVSPAGDSPFTTYSPSMDGQRRGNPFAGGVTSPSAFTSHPSIPRLQLHDHIRGSRPEGLTSPLRTTLSYPGQNDLGSPSSPLGGDSNGQMPYGMSYSCKHCLPTARVNTRN